MDIKRVTPFSSNQQIDYENKLSIEEQRELLAEGIGRENYDYLRDNLGLNTLDLLIYDSGVSNIINLMNEVIYCGGTADKFVDLISSTVASPEKIDPHVVLDLMNSTDAYLRTEPTLPSGDDTIAKIANMVCKVTNMDDLVYIVKYTPDYNGSGSPTEVEAVKRIALMLALVDETEDVMPSLINEVADTTAGRDKLTTLLSGVDDMRAMAEIINSTDMLNNILTVIEIIDNTGPIPTGTDSLIATINGVLKPSDLAYLMNQLDAEVSNIDNDDSFESGTLDYQSWATSGPQKWYVENGAASHGSFSARTNPDLGNLEVSVLELTAHITVDGAIQFDVQVDTEAGDDLKFYIDDILQDKWGGNTGWLIDRSYAVTAGIHRFRWELVKDESGTAGTNTARIDHVRLPGNKGAARTSAEKVGILLNQLDITAQNSVSDILNGLNSDVYGYTGINTLVEIINGVEYPVIVTDQARLVTIVNDISSINTMTELLRGVDSSGTGALVQLIDYSPNLSQLSNLINQLDGAGEGTKTTQVLNGLAATGAVNLASLVEGVDTANLVVLITQSAQVSHMSDILNAIYLHGSPNTTALGAYTGPAGGAKLAEVINQVDASATLNISPHLVRLLNDIAGSSLGPEAVGEIIGLMDPGAPSVSGITRLVKLLESLAATATPVYNNPLSNETGDDFGRLIELVKAMDVNGARNLGRMINEISCNDIENPGDCRVYNAADLVVNSNRVIYVARLITEMTNTQLVIDLLNEPATDFERIQVLLNVLGDDTYGIATIGSSPSNYYSDLYDWPAVDQDYLGRMIVTINNTAGTQGISNMISLINGVNFSDGVTDHFSTLIQMIRETHRIIYLSRMISDSSDLSLVVDLINALDPANPSEVNRLRDMVNILGDNSYGASTGLGVDPATFYTTDMDTSTSDQIGRMVLFINDLAAEVIATGGNQSTAIGNVVTMIKDSYDLAYITNLISGVERIQYLTNLIAQIDNIGLMMVIINGESGDGSDGAEAGRLQTVLSNYGGSTRFGAGTKSVGEMTMFADIIDILGSGRPISDQAKIVRLINEVDYCGITPSSDLSISGAGTPTDFFNCDSNVNFDYDANKGAVAYDQRHRLSNLMLGLDDANTMAVLVGDISDTTKTIRMMNGIRRINTAIYLVRWMPAEVTRDLLNYTELDVVFSSLVYLANNLAPDEYEAAQAFASMLHYGTGISHTQNRTDISKCHWYEGIGPKRTAELLNIEPGAYIETILQMFGWRTSVPALGCAFGTPNASGLTQTVSGTYRTGTFADTEYVYENADQTGAVLYSYGLPSTNSWCYSSSTSDPNNIGYIPEESGAIGYFEHSDTTVWQGFNPIPGVSVEPGLGGLWQVLKGQGIVGWLLQNGGEVGAPPVDTVQYGMPSCTNAAYSSEWECVKHGKDSGDHISDYRWGNFCTIPGYITPSDCESNGGRWTPDKNWDACFLDPATDSAVGN